MRRIVAILASGLLFFVAVVAGSSAAAKPEEKKPDQVLRCAHSYAEAIAEAKDRSCVIFATMHRDG